MNRIIVGVVAVGICLMITACSETKLDENLKENSVAETDSTSQELQDDTEMYTRKKNIRCHK